MSWCRNPVNKCKFFSRVQEKLRTSVECAEKVSSRRRDSRSTSRCTRCRNDIPARLADGVSGYEGPIADIWLPTAASSAISATSVGCGLPSATCARDMRSPKCSDCGNRFTQRNGLSQHRRRGCGKQSTTVTPFLLQHSAFVLDSN